MFAKLLPQNILFFDLFDQHAALITEAARVFQNSVCAPGESLKNLEEIHTLEHQADAIVRQCMEGLHKTFITPLEREDIHQLISKMDDILDSIDAAADCLLVYKIQCSTPELKSISEVLSKAVQEIELGVKTLRTMKDIQITQQHCKNIHQLEHEGDLILRNTLGRLYDEEKDLRLLIKWKEIYEIVESAIDQCKDVADILEGIMLDYF
jgi:uncharacterized protein